MRLFLVECSEVRATGCGAFAACPDKCPGILVALDRPRYQSILKMLPAPLQEAQGVEVHNWGEFAGAFYWLRLPAEHY